MNATSDGKVNDDILTYNDHKSMETKKSSASQKFGVNAKGIGVHC